MPEVSCRYCGEPAALVESAEVYGRSYDCDVWYCKPCGAWVGAHQDGRPKGTLAKAELRRMRTEFHHVFDWLWQAEVGNATGRARAKARGRWYAKLAETAGLPVEAVHGGRLTEETAPRVLVALEELRHGPA